MTKLLNEIEKILGVIALKRQRLEADMAALKCKDAELINQLQVLSEPLEHSLGNDDKSLTFALAASRWTIWRDHKKLAVEKARLDLSASINEMSQRLKRLSVQISALEEQRLTVQKQEKTRRDNQRAETRLMTWMNAQ